MARTPIRESGGDIFWDTAPDGKNWTTLVMAAVQAFGAPSSSGDGVRSPRWCAADGTS
jgi:hypothetical protein